MRERKPYVVHLAEVQDHDVLDTLVCTAQVLASKGMSQVLVALDNGRAAHGTWARGFAAEIRPLRCAGLSIFGRARALEREFSNLFQEKRPYAVHLHGLGPCLLGFHALNGNSQQLRILYSPHLTQLGASWIAALLSRLLQAQLSPLDYEALATSLTEAEALSKLLNRSPEVLPLPVSDIFFATPICQSAPRTILAAGSGIEAVNVVTRLCVLLNGREARVPFSWLGPAEPGLKAQLEAANVQVFDVADDGERAQVLSRSFAFIHVSRRNDLPLAVARAMAAGVPCLVSDISPHRALVRHGETGYVCTSERDFLEKIVLLLRDRAERVRIGESARIEAEQRFSLRHFERAVLRAYGISSEFQATGVGSVPSTPGPHVN